MPVSSSTPRKWPSTMVWVGKLLTPLKPISFTWSSQCHMRRRGSVAWTPQITGHFLDHGQHFVFADLHGDGVGVAVGHHAAGGAVAHHAEAAGVVDDDEIRATALDEFGADAGAGAGGDDGVPREGGAQAVDDFFAGVGVAFAGPGIGHGADRNVFASGAKRF
jgi:hypothetical protein